MNEKAARQKLALRKAFSAKKKDSTPSSRRHHFEPFTQRIAKLKIDPIRRLRITDDDGTSKGLTSHFRISLEKWRETNLSEDFTQFSREVGSLCDNLPQVLHHQDRIIDLLLEYIEKGKTVSVEPLLDLVPRLAQDIQTQFERHFDRTIKTVSLLAAKHSDPEVVEWSFNCLAWLFKYLERLLIPNLCPLYDLLAPLLGRERQKPFVVRFAAESLSFLVKKASKNREYTLKIVKHAVLDLCMTFEEHGKGIDMYEQGLTTLFVEAINGVQRHLHSRGDVVFRELLSQVSEINESSASAVSAIRVLRGVLVSAINHTTPESFKPVLDILLSHVEEIESSPNPSKIMLSTQLLLLLSAVRNGTRVTDWAGVLRTLTSYIQYISSQDPSCHPQTANELLSAFAVAHQACSLETALSHVKVFDDLCCPLWQHSFLGFCSLYSELGNDRFRGLLLPYFQRFIATQWDGNTRGLSVLLPQFINDGRLVQDSLKMPRSWQNKILTEFEVFHASQMTSSTTDEVAVLNGLLEMTAAVPLETGIAHNINSRLSKALISFLKSDRLKNPTNKDYLLLGSGFNCIANSSVEDESAELWDLLCSATPKLQPLPIFYQSLLAFIRSRHRAISLEGPSTQLLVDSLIMNLSSPSHKLRLAALEILQILGVSKSPEVKAMLSSAASIEQSKPSLETARSISMQLRNLGSSYCNLNSDPWIANAIPHFCFGLLYVKFAQVWEDACSALKEMCESKEGEQIICEIACRWLEGSPDTHVETPVVEIDSNAPPVEGDIRFGGPGFERIQTLIERNLTLASPPEMQLELMFKKRYTPARVLTPFSRTQALKVLKTIPQVAEKRSRILVPVLLSWALQPRSDLDLEVLPDDDEDSNVEVQIQELQRWHRKDQKALLSLFALFLNPRVLFRSNDVYTALLSLLEHGDVDIQKSALRAIFTWKNPSIVRYEEDLLKLLDDAKFREQITVFLNGNGDGSLRDEDREASMPIILRLLYGRVITRGKADQRSNRRAIFILLSQFQEAEVNQFINIALGSINDLSLVEAGTLNFQQLEVEHLPQRRQFGLLNMLKDLLDAWKSTAGLCVPRLVDPIFFCLIRATREITFPAQEQETEEIASKSSFARSIRQVALQNMNILFEIGLGFDWEPYLKTLFSEVIDPRLEKLATETAQGTSGMLRMFSTWAHSAQLAPILAKQNPLLLSKIAECIGLSSAKTEVKKFVINDILRALIDLAADTQGQSTVFKEMLMEYSSPFLVQIALLLRSDPPRDLLEDAISAVSGLALYTSYCPVQILSTSADLLQLPSRFVSHQVKCELLHIILHFFYSLKDSDEARSKVFSAICSSFAYFTDGASRTLLSKLVRKFAEEDDLGEVADLCEELNSFISDRLDQPDFDRRARAFNTINEEKFAIFTAEQWRLLLGNLMFYVKDIDELAVRASASYGLRRFVEAASLKEGSEREEFMKMVKDTILAGVEKGLRDQPELVKAELLAILAHIVRFHPRWDAVSDMHCLLDNDEELSFFNNALNIQKYRRVGALKRLSEQIKLGKLSGNSLYHRLLPLLEYFAFDSGDGVLAGEATRTLGPLIEWVDWQQCRALLRRYIGYIQSKPDIQDTILKLIDAVTIAVCHSATIKTQQIAANAALEAASKAEDVEGSTRLARTMPGPEKLSQYLLQDVLPPLSRFLHDKDESFVSRRVNIAVVATRYMKLLPQDEFQLRFPPLLTDVCNILRSMDQGSRDMTRKALSTMCKLVGPSSVGFVLRELKSALQRGFFLHVLSYTVHSILETATSTFQPGDLDYCAGDIVAIVMEDVFGNIGKEKDAKEYLADKKTKKEVKGKKSFDSLQLLASVTSLSHLVELIRPLEMMLVGSLKHRDVINIDELLRRMELGLLQNKSVHDREVLVFCFELVQDAQKPAAPKINGAASKSAPNKYLVRDMPKPMMDGSLQKTKVAGRITRFALELVRSVLKKHRDLQTPANIAGFMPVIGDALISNQEDVKLAAIRLFTGILNVPLPRIDSDAPVYIAEAARIIEDSHTTNDELSQAALKLISAVLRERRSAPVKIKEHTVAVLLKKLKPDLQVISQQGAAFNLLKAIIARKIVVPEVYEVVDGDDGVAAISVRDHDRTTRDLARGVYFQFLMEFPQGKERFAKQLTFLVRNLEFEHAEGRQSVMETLHLLMNKVGDALVSEIVHAAFWPLVSVMVNDDSSDCREMAASLVKAALGRADEEWTKNFLILVQKLLGEETKPIQKRTALQCWTLYLEVKGAEAKTVSFVLRAVLALLEEESDDFSTEEWQLTYYALHTMLLLCKHRPDQAFAIGARPIWTTIRSHLTFPQAWVKQEAAKLIGLYVADFASAGTKELSKLPLVGSLGLELDGNELCNLTAKNLHLLRDGVSEELAAQAVRNLAFLGRCFAANEMQWERRYPKESQVDGEKEKEESSSDAEEEAEETGDSKEGQSAISHLFYRLATILRREPRKLRDSTDVLYRRAESLYTKSAALNLIAALCSSLPTTTLHPSIDTLLLPLIHLTSADITAPSSGDPSFAPAYNELVTNATELMDMLQKKMGTTEYVKCLQRVKWQIAKRRNERREKRKIDAVAAPDKAERVKQRKRESGKARRKEIGALERGKRRGW